MNPQYDLGDTVEKVTETGPSTVYYWDWNTSFTGVVISDFNHNEIHEIVLSGNYIPGMSVQDRIASELQRKGIRGRIEIVRRP